MDKYDLYSKDTRKELIANPNKFFDDYNKDVKMVVKTNTKDKIYFVISNANTDINLNTVYASGSSSASTASTATTLSSGFSCISTASSAASIGSKGSID